MSEDTNLDKLIKKTEETMSGEFSPITVCITAMKIVETFPNLKGSEKKHLVLKCVEVLIRKIGGSELVLDILPLMIDNIISVEKGELVIGNEKVTSCCLSLRKLCNK
jgi:hypothetical protein